MATGLLSLWPIKAYVGTSHSTLSELISGTFLFLHRVMLIAVHDWSVDHELPEGGGSRVAILKVCSREPWECLWPFQGGSWGQNYFYNSAKIWFAFSLLFSHKCTVQFCDTGWHQPLKANGMCACIFLCFKSFSVLPSNIINIDLYYPPKQKLSGGSR